MSATLHFDANRRLAEAALWADSGAHWIERATAKPDGAGSEFVTITFRRADLASFVAGIRGVSRALMGLAPPIPPPIAPASARPHLRLVSSGGE